MNISECKYLGVLCKRGHDWQRTGKSLRYKRNGKCIECGRQWTITHKTNRKKIDSKCYLKNRDKARLRGLRYYYLHKKESNERNKIYRETHKDNLKEYRQKRHDIKRIYLRERRKNDIKFKLNRNMACLINHSLRGNKAGRHWESLLGYTLDELKQHLEKQFAEGMTWENYGKWHLDHIVPVSAFNFSSPEHIDFRRCWMLDNLQPLWANENIIKSNKLYKSFQPNLAL